MFCHGANGESELPPYFSRSGVFLSTSVNSVKADHVTDFAREGGTGKTTNSITLQAECYITHFALGARSHIFLSLHTPSSLCNSVDRGLSHTHYPWVVTPSLVVFQPATKNFHVSCLARRDLSVSHPRIYIVGPAVSRCYFKVPSTQVREGEGQERRAAVPRRHAGPHSW